MSFITDGWPACRKPLSDLRAVRTDRGVELTFQKSTPFFKATHGSAEAVPIRVFRQEHPGFEFGRDGEEYFDSISCSTGDLLHEATLAPENGRGFSFTDNAVETGRTYAYWVGVAGTSERLTGPVPVRVRHRGVWWPQQRVDQSLRAIGADFPDQATVESFGHTRGNRQIPGLIAGRKDRLIGCVGLIHGGESGPELLIPAVARLLRQDAALLSRMGIALLPAVNIDERERQVEGCPWYLRKNSHGVDLNRNFPAWWEQVEYGYGLTTADPHAATYRGPSPASEPETRAVMQFIDRSCPQAVFVFHHLASLTGARFLASSMGEGDGAYHAACRSFTQAYTQGMYADPARPLRLVFKASAGSLPSWLYHRRHTPAFDLEGDGGKEFQSSAIDQTTPAQVERYADLHYQGLLAVLKTFAP